MQIQISKEINKKIKEASKILGLEGEEIVDRAVLLYLDNIEKYLHLKKEFQAWDKLSDEALVNFEKSL